MDMKRHHVRLAHYERGLLINALNRFRTDLLKEKRDATPVNEVLAGKEQISSRSRPGS